MPEKCAKRSKNNHLIESTLSHDPLILLRRMKALKQDIAKDQVRDWLDHVEAVILGLRDKELGILPLDQLIGRTVMRPVK